MKESDLEKIKFFNTKEELSEYLKENYEPLELIGWDEIAGPIFKKRGHNSEGSP